MSKYNVEVSLETMLNRFKNSYEDAAHGVPYNGREGGYQYLPGAGPCEPLEVLQEEFPDADPAVLQEAADILSSQAGAWVRKRVYGV